MKGSFSEEALLQFAELAAQAQSLEFSEGGTYDFTRCVRPNGSAYGTGGQCKKGTEEASALDVLQGGIKGRVPRNDPKEPLRSGSTPLEKAKEKLKLFEQKLSDPNRTPSDKELEQFGKLKMAVEEFENKRDGQKKGLFGRQDNSDLDESKTREFGKKIREWLPKIEDRQTLVKARQIHLRYLRKEDSLLRRRGKATTQEILQLERYNKEISETKVRLKSVIERLPKNDELRSGLNNFLQTVIKAENSYGKVLEKLS